MSGSWVTVKADRVSYVDRGRDVILCTDQRFPNGAELVVFLSDAAKEKLRYELKQTPRTPE